MTKPEPLKGMNLKEARELFGQIFPVESNILEGKLMDKPYAACVWNYAGCTWNGFRFALRVTGQMEESEFSKFQHEDWDKALKDKEWIRQGMKWTFINEFRSKVCKEMNLLADDITKLGSNIPECSFSQAETNLTHIFRRLKEDVSKLPEED